MRVLATVCRPPPDPALAAQLYSGGFGVCLLADPMYFFGKGGVMPYFNTDCSPVGKFFGRGFGAMLTALAAQHWLEGPSTALLKQMTLAMALTLPPIWNNLNDDKNFIANIWKAQVLAHAALLAITAKAAGYY